MASNDILINRFQALLGAADELTTAVRNNYSPEAIRQLTLAVYRVALEPDIDPRTADYMSFVPPDKAAELAGEMAKILTGALDETADFIESDPTAFQRRFDKAAALARDLVRDQAANSIDDLYPPLGKTHCPVGQVEAPSAPRLVTEEEYFAAVQDYAVNNYAARGWKFQNGMAETVRQWYRDGIPYSIVFEALDTIAAQAPGDPAGPVFTHHYSSNRLVRQAWVRAGRPSIHRAVLEAAAEKLQQDSWHLSVSERLQAGAVRLRAAGAIKLADSVEAIAEAIVADPAGGDFSFEPYEEMMRRRFVEDLPETLRERFYAEVDRKLRGIRMPPDERERTRQFSFIARARRHFALDMPEVFL